MRLLVLFLLPLLAGCVEDDREMYRWSGAFTADRADDDIRAFSAEAGKYGDVAILESFPEQFVVSRLDASGCQFLQPFIETRDYIASHSGCVPMPMQP